MDTHLPVASRFQRFSTPYAKPLPVLAAGRDHEALTAGIALLTGPTFPRVSTSIGVLHVDCGRTTGSKYATHVCTLKLWPEPNAIRPLLPALICVGVRVATNCSSPMLYPPIEGTRMSLITAFGGATVLSCRT